MMCTISQHVQASLVVVCVIMRGMVWIIIASISQQILVIENTGLGHVCLSSRPQLTTEWTISVPDRNQPQCTLLFRTKHYAYWKQCNYVLDNRVRNKPISEIDSNWVPSMQKRFLSRYVLWNATPLLCPQPLPWSVIALNTQHTW